MKTASKILLIINSVISAIGAILYLIFAILFFALGASKDALVKYMSEHPDFKLPDGMSVDTALKYFNYLAVVFLILMLISIAAVVICILANKKKNKGLYITVIVLSVLHGSILGLLGGIFGLVARNNNNGPEIPQAEQAE